MNRTDLYRLFSASVVVTILFYANVVSAGNEDVMNHTDAICLTHPDDRADDHPHVLRVADDLAKTLLTPEVLESVDVFYIPKIECEEWCPEAVIYKLLKAYRMGETMKLNVKSRLLDLTLPNRKIASAQQLYQAVKEIADTPTDSQFQNLILGKESDNSDEMAKSLMQAFFSDDCRHSLALEVSDGEQLDGFFLGTLREGEDNNKVLVGLLFVWD